MSFSHNVRLAEPAIFYQGWWHDQGHKWNPISASSLARTGGVEERHYMVHVPWERLLQVQLIHQGLILWYKLEPKWEGGSSVVVHRASWLCACLSVCLFIYLSIMCLSKGKIVLVQGNARRIIVQCSGPVPICEVSAGFAFGAC